MTYCPELYIKTFSNSQDKLTAPFSCSINTKNTKGTITVPKGFITDYASVPRIFLGIIPKIGKTRKPAVVHDYLYSKNCKVKITRKEADDIFFYLMDQHDVKSFKKYLIYCIIRLFGSFNYKKK